MKHLQSSHRMMRGCAVATVVVALSACVVRPLPPYNPPPLPDPRAPAETYPVPGSTLPPTPSSPVLTQPAPPADDRHLVALAADLSGAEVVPPVETTGHGEFAAVYDRNTRLLRWKSSVSGLRGELIGAAFHGPADLEQNAPPIIEWQGAAGRARYEGRATLTPAQASSLLAGMWYVSVRSRAYPQGELRGQITIR